MMMDQVLVIIALLLMMTLRGLRAVNLADSGC
jgi:hypothetical protein